MTPGTAWRSLGVALAAIAALALRESAVWPLTHASVGTAQIRQSWSARPRRVEQCRRLSDAELAALPPHMRLRTQCEGRFARYLLTLTVDGRRVSLDTLLGGGMRHDRPIHVFDELTVAPGTRHLRLDVVQLDSAAADTAVRGGASPGDTLLGARASRESDERDRRDSEAIPSRLALDTVLRLTAGQVVLLSYDGVRRLFLARGGS